MPNYKYECTSCGHEFDTFQPFSADSLKKCPECKKKKLFRVIGKRTEVRMKSSPEDFKKMMMNYDVESAKFKKSRRNWV